MPKTAVSQWDNVAANNQDLNGVGILGTNVVSNFDNALRELMAQIAATPLDETAATMLANLSGVATSRTISAGGIATGGGDLSANRTITVTKSTNAQAIAFVDDTTAMTPIRTGEAVLAALNAPGSIIPIYAVRTWCRFNGTGTPAVISGGNVSSITDLGVGSYDVNFTTAIGDTSYGTLATTSTPAGTISSITTAGVASAKVTIATKDVSNAAIDISSITVAILR